VFFAACPTTTPDQFWKKPMLPMALDALLDVMTTPIDQVGAGAGVVELH
jgi:hypothetical protein